MAARTRRTGLIIGTLVLFLAGCSTSSFLEKSLRGKVTNLQIHSKGGEHFVVIKDGNLVDVTVFSSEERLILLEDFINKYKLDFGIATSDSLQFVKPNPEFDFEFGEKLLTAVLVFQYINGMRILDREQLGIFDSESGALKAVRINVTDPTSLKRVTMPKRKDIIQSLAARFLEAQGIVITKITAFDDPVYSVAAGMAGFEVRCTSRTNSQYFMRIRLLVNTDSDTVVFLSKEEIDVPQTPSEGR